MVEDRQLRINGTLQINSWGVLSPFPRIIFFYAEGIISIISACGAEVHCGHRQSYWAHAQDLQGGGFQTKITWFQTKHGPCCRIPGWIWGLDGLDQDLTSDSSCLLLYSRLNLLGLSKMIWLATSPSGWQFQLLHLRGSEWTMFPNRSEPARAYPEKKGGTCF